MADVTTLNLLAKNKTRLYKMATKECKDCGKEFEFTPGRYPRKYCDKCSKQRKKDYENIHTITVDQCED